MMVWPALFPAEYRATIFAFSARRSTILPLPSSPHWPPTTTIAGIYKGPSCGPSFPSRRVRRAKWKSSRSIAESAVMRQAIQPQRVSA